jgi:hypothetical protein
MDARMGIEMAKVSIEKQGFIQTRHLTKRAPDLESPFLGLFPASGIPFRRRLHPPTSGNASRWALNPNHIDSGTS